MVPRNKLDLALIKGGTAVWLELKGFAAVWELAYLLRGGNYKRIRVIIRTVIYRPVFWPVFVQSPCGCLAGYCGSDGPPTRKAWRRHKASINHSASMLQLFRVSCVSQASESEVLMFPCCLIFRSYAPPHACGNRII